MYCSGNSTFISGQIGRYDYKIKDASVRYGRNSASNLQKKFEAQSQKMERIDVTKLVSMSDEDFEKTMNELKSDKPITFNFVQQYMPNIGGKIDRMALMGAAYEEMGKVVALSVDELSENLQTQADALYGKGELALCADALDINKDGFVDIGEYASSILLEDALSESKFFQNENINGEINEQGQKRVLELTKEENYYKASHLFQALHARNGLATAGKYFAFNRNNLVQ